MLVSHSSQGVKMEYDSRKMYIVEIINNCNIFSLYLISFFYFFSFCAVWIQLKYNAIIGLWNLTSVLPWSEKVNS